MRIVLDRTLGFALPTVAIVTALHLQKLATWGEALDGVVSGLTFAVLFGLGTAVAEFPARARPPFDVRERPLLSGLIAGLILWSLQFAFWSVPATAPLRTIAFPIQCATMAAAGAVTSGLARRRLNRA